MITNIYRTMRRIFHPQCLSAGLAAVVFFAADNALAHHPLGGMPMHTFMDGLLSGIGHPVLGFDHLFFILAVGILSAFTARIFTMPLTFVIGMVGGVGIMMAGGYIPMAEYIIAMSVLLLGVLVLSGRTVPPLALVLFFATAGIVHGWAFGETILGQESLYAHVIAGYLLGLIAIQWGISVATGLAVRRGWRAVDATDLRVRISGGIITGVGALLLLEGLEGAVVNALGWVA